jgi:hypothetical protein
MLSGADAKDGVVLEQCAIGSAEMPPSASCAPTVAEEGFRLWEECLTWGGISSLGDLLVTYYRLLTRQGYRVFTAPSRTRGLLALDREPPALVIVTLSLRDGNGLDVIRAARELEAPAAAILVSRCNNER